MNDTWLVVGLGNPGPDYSSTRHNIGFMVADHLAGSLQVGFRAHKSRAHIAEARLGPGQPKVIIVKPQTYMNLSGGPVGGLANFFGISPDHVIAVHDELDIPFEIVRLKRGGGEGGHNGLRDITQALGTKDYYRVRVGIGRPPGRSDAAGYVLKPFTAAERKQLPLVVQTGADAVQALIEEGLVAAQQKFHAPAE